MLYSFNSAIDIVKLEGGVKAKRREKQEKLIFIKERRDALLGHSEYERRTVELHLPPDHPNRKHRQEMAARALAHAAKP